MNIFNKHLQLHPAHCLFTVAYVLSIFVVVNGQFYNNNNKFQSQRFGQQGQQLHNNRYAQEQRNQYYQYQQRNFQGANSGNYYPKAPSNSGTQFINTPVSSLNGTAGAVVQIQLLSYSDPGLTLPGGNTCACPEGQTCPYLQQGIPSCYFAFTIIISAPNQSVQYIASDFVPVTSSPINSGDWTTVQLLNMTTKPMVIDIFVHHLGVVISEATASLEYFDHLVHVDTFVVSLANYQATPYGSTTPNTVQTTAIGQLQGTSLQLAYNVQCIGSMQGPNCDLTCTPVSSGQSTACVSSITGMQMSCMNVSNVVSNCTPCPYGLTPDQTACSSSASISSVPTGVSPAFRVWTIILGCLLGIAIVFIILLVVIFIAVESRKKTDAKSHYVENPYSGRSTRPLLYQDDDDWRRGKTRATTGGSGVSSRSPVSDRETNEEEFPRSNGASIARREAHV